MKIGDVKIGTEYGALDSPSRSYRDDLPRRVEVLEIVTVEEGYWPGGGYASRATRKMRRIKVRVLDAPLHSKSFYRREIDTAAKDAEIVVEARQLIAPWTELRKDVQEKIDAKQAAKGLKASLEARIEALGLNDGRRAGYSYARVDDYRPDDPSLSIDGAYNVERLLSLAEKGLAAEQ